MADSANLAPREVRTPVRADLAFLDTLRLPSGFAAERSAASAAAQTHRPCTHANTEDSLAKVVSLIATQKLRLLLQVRRLLRCRDEILGSILDLEQLNLPQADG